MNNRTKEYLKQRKAWRTMQHPTDLATFLKAELELTRCKTVKKDILKTIDLLEHKSPEAETAHQ